MELETVYRLNGNGYEDKACFVFDITMQDDIGSHRYYYLDENLQMKRIKTINRMLEYFEHSGVELGALSNNEANKLVYYLSTFYRVSKDKNNNYNIVDNTREIDEFTDNLADATEFDDNIIVKSIKGWTL